MYIFHPLEKKITPKEAFVFGRCGISRELRFPSYLAMGFNRIP